MSNKNDLQNDRYFVYVGVFGDEHLIDTESLGHRLFQAVKIAALGTVGCIALVLSFIVFYGLFFL